MAAAGELFRALLRQLDGLLDPAAPTYVPGAYLSGMIWLRGGADIFSDQPRCIRASMYLATILPYRSDPAPEARCTARLACKSICAPNVAC